MTSRKIPMKQLWGAIGAVFGSWKNDRAIAYRKMYDIPESWGTAVNVQSMVFGNMGDDFGHRRRLHARRGHRREHLLRRVPDERAGRRRRRRHAHAAADFATCASENPAIYEQLDEIRQTLEKHYRDMMDIEFTIQKGKLYMLQCRVGKRTAFAAIKIAVDMVEREAHHATRKRCSASSPISSTSSSGRSST